MHIHSATFIKGIVGTTDTLDDGRPQIAFIGRSNAGKSSLINTIANQKKLARTSSTPGRTQQINLYFINRAFYFLDLPGYGYAKASKEDRAWLQKLINWYLFKTPYQQKYIVLIIDANLGPTDSDMEMLRALEEHQKEIIVVANKIDKIRKPDYDLQWKNIQTIIGNHTILPFSSHTKLGVRELTTMLLDN